MVTVSLNSINGNTIPTDDNHAMEKLDPTTKNSEFVRKCRTRLDDKSDVIALILILLFCWAITYSILGDRVGLGSQTVSLIVSFFYIKFLHIFKIFIIALDIVSGL